jgi:hypothetical protein
MTFALLLLPLSIAVVATLGWLRASPLWWLLHRFAW